ncbi:MAG: CvpA family protein [Elusimicrobiota bacterium]|jgi:uncharacterized membrane protein required for colicin V production|nr:CvpA family protein [Elusimicrobiota bacterium]
MLDIIAIIILLFCAGYGLYNGFIKVLFYLLSIILGSVIAAKCYIYGSNFLPEGDWTLLFSFAIIFFISSFIITLIGKFFTKFFEKILLKPADRILGMFFVCFLGTLMIGMLYQGILSVDSKFLKKYHNEKAEIVKKIYNFDKKCYDILPTSLKDKMSLKNLTSKTKKVTKEIPDIELVIDK